MDIVSVVMRGHGLRMVELRQLPENDEELKELVSIMAGENESGQAALIYRENFLSYQPVLVIKLLEPATFEEASCWLAVRKWARERLTKHLPANWQLDLKRFSIVLALDKESGRNFFYIALFFIEEEVLTPEEVAELMGAKIPRAVFSSC
jgi:hypothetical protein